MLVHEQGGLGSVHHGVEALLLESLGRVLKRTDEDVKLISIVQGLVFKIVGNQSCEAVHPLLHHRLLHLGERQNNYWWGQWSCQSS